MEQKSSIFGSFLVLHGFPPIKTDIFFIVLHYSKAGASLNHSSGNKSDDNDPPGKSNNDAATTSETTSKQVSRIAKGPVDHPRIANEPLNTASTGGPRIWKGRGAPPQMKKPSAHTDQAAASQLSCSSSEYSIEP